MPKVVVVRVELTDEQYEKVRKHSKTGSLTWRQLIDVHANYGVDDLFEEIEDYGANEKENR